MFRNICILLTLALTLVATGCSGGGRSSVTGTVTLGGAPLAEGTLNFAPVDTKQGSPTGVMIKNGAFTLDAKPGIAPGSYIVTCNSFEKPAEASPAELMANGAPAQANDLVPASWNEQQNKVEIKKGKNELKFEIPAE